MTFLSPKYETYQDVKTTLSWWSIPIWALLAWVTWRIILEPAHRMWLAKQLPDVASWAGELGAIGASLAIGVVLSVLLVHILQIHDKWYDRHVVKWRRDYVSEFIIPRLIEPHSDRLPPNAVQLANEQWGLCMRCLFYHFAGDRDMKIRKNLVTRFYERITTYWFVQLVEIAILALFIISLVYTVVLAIANGFPERLVVLWVVLAVVLVCMLLISKHLREWVSEATIEEIEAILSHSDFEAQLKLFCDEAEIPLRA